MPAQTPAVQNYNALIKHHIRQLTVIPDIGCLHKYTVFDFCTLADMNSAEKHGIFDFTLDMQPSAITLLRALPLPQ